jgi:hypothetical protein
VNRLFIVEIDDQPSKSTTSRHEVVISRREAATRRRIRRFTVEIDD